MFDYRTDRRYGWDVLKPRPKEKDLVVVTDENSEYFNRVLRLHLDDPRRQTVEVCTDLVSGYGVHVNFYRRDVRTLQSSDDILLIKELVMADNGLIAADDIRSRNEADDHVKALRQEKFDIILEAIKTQPFGKIFNDDTCCEDDQTLAHFVSLTWIADKADELFKNVANRVLDALERN